MKAAELVSRGPIWAALCVSLLLLSSGCENKPDLPDPGDPSTAEQGTVSSPEIPGKSQEFLDMELPPGQFVRVLPAGEAYDAENSAAFRSLCLNCHAVSQTSFSVEAWAQSAHARAGIMCGACHGPHEEAFISKPGPERCRSCHAAQYDDFVSSGHGPEKAPGMGCCPCHEVHATDRRLAMEVTTCTGCHLASEHVQGYPNSRMGVVFMREGYDEDGDLRAPDCVFCHMPPSPLMEETGDFRNDKVTLHNTAITIRKHPKDQNRLSDETVELLTPLCVQCHSERNSRHRLENSDPLLLDWTPIGMTRDAVRMPIPAANTQGSGEETP
jgi:hypothetical protein